MAIDPISQFRVTISTAPMPTGHRPSLRFIVGGHRISALSSAALRSCCRSTSRR